MGNSPGKRIRCFSLSNDLYKTDRAVHDKQALRPTVWQWALGNKPAAGIQAVFETSFSLLHALSRSTGPFYIWHPVANPALPSRHTFARQMSGGWAGSPGERGEVVRCGRMRGAHTGRTGLLGETPAEAGLGELEVGRLTFPAQADKPGGRSEQLWRCQSSRHRLPKVPSSRWCLPQPTKGRAERWSP